MNPGLAVVFVYAGHFLVDFYMALIPPLLPLISRRFGLSLTAAGVLLTASSLATSWSQPAFGALARRKDGARLLAAALVWTALAMTLLGFAPSYGYLLLLAALGGLGSGLYHPVGARAATFLGGTGRGRAVSTYMAIGTAGLMVAPLVVVPLVIHLGWRACPLLFLPAAALAPALARTRLTLPPETAPGAHGGGQDSSSPVWRRNDTLLLLVLIAGLRMWVLNSACSFLPTYAVGLGYSEVAAARFLSLYYLGSIGGDLLGGALSDRYGHGPTILGTCVLGIVIYFLFLAATGPWRWVCLPLAAATVKAVLPAAVVRGQETSPGNEALASGLVVGVAFGLGGLGVAFTGTVSDHLGLPTALRLNTLLLVASLVLTVLLPRERAARRVQSYPA